MENNKYEPALYVYNCLYNTNYRDEEIKSKFDGTCSL